MSDSEEFELAVDTPLNLICFAHRDGDEATEAIMRQVNGGGDLYLTHTKLRDRFTLRMSIGQTRTERVHVENAWQQLLAASRTLTAS